MKKTVFFLLLLMLCAAFSHACADGGPCGVHAEWTLSADGVLTISGTGPMDDFQTASDMPWKGVRDKIKSVVIEEGITTIGDDAFYACADLTSVTLPESLRIIGDAAFESCKALTSITIPDGVLSIGRAAFAFCAGLTEFQLPASVEAIDEQAFYKCTGLTAVTLPDTLKYIGPLAFQGCTALTGIAIPASVSFISERDAFTDCKSLQEITADPANADYASVDGVLFNKDQSRLLYYPAGKTDASYTVLETVTSINDRAFASNASLVSLTIPGSAETIGSGAFSGCGSLEQIPLPEGIRSIGDEAFVGCRKLTELSFPASLIFLGADPFRDCFSLTSISAAEGSELLSSADGVLFSADKTVLRAYPPAKAGDTYAVPDGVKKIADDAFAGCEALVSVTFQIGRAQSELQSRE